MSHKLSRASDKPRDFIRTQFYNCKASTIGDTRRSKN